MVSCDSVCVNQTLHGQSSRYYKSYAVDMSSVSYIIVCILRFKIALCTTKLHYNTNNKLANNNIVANILIICQFFPLHHQGQLAAKSKCRIRVECMSAST